MNIISKRIAPDKYYLFTSNGFGRPSCGRDINVGFKQSVIAVDSYVATTTLRLWTTFQ